MAFGVKVGHRPGPTKNGQNFRFGSKVKLMTI